MIEIGRHGTQTDFDVAQAVAAGELREGHAEKLIEAGKFPESALARVAPNARIEFVLGQEVEELGKNGSASVHVPFLARC